MTTQVDVTQADRDAAADVEEMWNHGWGGEVFRDGVADDHPLVQAFARHRLTAEQAKDAEIERMQEALRQAEAALPVLATMCGVAGLNAGEARANEILADIRQALTKGPTDADG